jgi:hypothetical protein
VGEVGEGWLEEITPAHLRIYLCHIAAHLLLLHFRRGAVLHNDPRWDYSCDLEANHLLITINSSTFKQIKPVKRRWLGLSAEEIFLKLRHSNNITRQMGFGDDHRSWRNIREMDSQSIIRQSFASRILSPEQLNTAFEQFHQQISNNLNIPSDTKITWMALPLTAGKSTGGAVEYIPPAIGGNLPFRLQNIIEATVTKRRGFSRPEYDILLLWQQKYAEIVLPLYPRQIVIGIDTSGSMSKAGLQTCASLVITIVKTLQSIYPTTEIYVAQVDADFQSRWVSTYASEQLPEFLATMKGRGGTEIFRSIQKLIDKEQLKPEAIILISDFDTADTDRDLVTDSTILGIIINEQRDCQKTLEEKKNKFRSVKFIASIPVAETKEVEDSRE